MPSLTFARKMSPVEIFGTAKCDGDELRLGALPRTGRPDQDEPHLAQEALVVAQLSWLSICFTVSRPTPTMIRTAVPPNGKFWLRVEQGERDQREERDRAEVERAGQR